MTPAVDAKEPWLLDLFELAPRLIRLMDAVLRDLSPSVTFRQYRLLERVAEGNTTLTEIGRVATLSLPAISETLDVLARKGLLRRHVDGEDRRSSQLVLTREGVRTLETARQHLDELCRQLLEGLPAEVDDQTRQQLRIVNARVTARLRERR